MDATSLKTQSTHTMKLVRYQHPLTDAFGDFDRWFRSPWDGFGRLLEMADRLGSLPATGANALGADLYEDDAHYHVRLELPGVKKSELQVELQDRQLAISCERPSDGSGETADKAVYKRVLTVPDGIDAEQVSAKLEDGILTVTLPKSSEKRPRQIEVK